MHTNHNTVVYYYASEMILHVHSDALYLSAGRGQSRAGEYFFLGGFPKDGPPIKLNGNIAVTCVIPKLVAGSSAEAEFGALFLMCRRKGYHD